MTLVSGHEFAGTDLGARDLAVRYGDSPAVFAGVTFSIRHGEIAALIGANGAGKSTLLKCCLGLISPCAGEITLFGNSMSKAKPSQQRRLRGGVGFVAQRHNLVARLSVLSNVVHGLLAAHPGPRYWLQSFAPTIARARALDALARVDLTHLALRRADSLSGGECQRVAIARALVADPHLIIADEPAASLDPAIGEEMMAIFARASSESKTTLIFATHNLEHALKYTSRVLGLRDGRLSLDAPTNVLTVGALRGFYS
jgi:phosphonate transport system ATP-binding protein